MLGKNKPLHDIFAIKKEIAKLTIIVPVYNEAKTVATALSNLISYTQILSRETEILVVESNSSDGSRNIVKVFEKSGAVKVFYQDIATGKGNAVRLGLDQATGDVVVIYDADEEYETSDMDKLIQLIESGSTSFALGTRHQQGNPMRVMAQHKIRSYILNQAHVFFVWFFNVSFGVKLTDPFTMYKMFRREIFNNIILEANRFDFDWEIAGKAILLGSKPVETPITYNARGFSDGKKIRIFRDPITWIVLVFKIKLESFKAKPS